MTIALLALSIVAVGCLGGPVQPRFEATVIPSAIPIPSATPMVDTVQWLEFADASHPFHFRYPQACGMTELNGSLYVGRIELAVLDARGLGLHDFVTAFVGERTNGAGWTLESTTSGTIAGREAIVVEYRFGDPVVSARRPSPLATTGFTPGI